MIELDIKGINNMNQVCDLLDIELNQGFSVYGDNDLYRISERGIERFIEKDWHTAPASILEDLLLGVKIIKPDRFKPNEDDIYYYICEKEKGIYTTLNDVWVGDVTDLERYKLGNCFKSYKNAELEKNRYIRSLKKYYEGFIE